jgi:hypothetical protein
MSAAYVCEAVVGLYVITIAKRPWGAKSSLFARARKSVLLCGRVGLAQGIGGGENKRLLLYFFAVSLALAIFTATGTAIAMITGVMPGAKSMPSPAILTASKYGDALEWLGQLKLSSSLRRLTLLDSWKASKKLRKVY